MKTATLVARSLTYFWRTHLAVVAGVATAVSVLAGALLVGSSVRASLRDLVLGRLGNADLALSAASFFRERLGEEIRADRRFGGRFGDVCPIIALPGFLTHEKSGRRAARVLVYGVDERFWRFHGFAEARPTPEGREALLSEGLARELDSSPGDVILLRVSQPSDVPSDSLHGEKDDMGRTLRLTAREWPAEISLRDFALSPEQGEVRAVYVALNRLQRDLERREKVNTLLFSGVAGAEPSDLAPLLETASQLEDLGVRVRPLEKLGQLQLESDGILLGDGLVEAAEETAKALDWRSSPILTYLANSIRADRKEIPYSLVSGLDPAGFARLGLPEPSASSLVLNDWTARELDAAPGAKVTLEYYLWEDAGRMATASADFELSAIVPLKQADDPDLAPRYPGITESEDLSDWEPPFPIDLKRIRPQDEAYWDEHRTTPKAFIPLARAQEIWPLRYGKVTSIRISPPAAWNLEDALAVYQERLRESLDPLGAGFAIYPVRAEGLLASRGATDFGEYFLYFSFFLVVSALVLAGLFFRLGVEQRLREIGALEAMGFPPERIRNGFLMEGLVLASSGSLIGLFGAVAYAELILLGLRTWWIDAVGTRLLTVHVSPAALVLGGLGGVLAALLAIAWTLRGLRSLTTRSLLTGVRPESGRATPEKRRIRLAAWGSAVSGLALLLAAGFGAMGQTAGFFGAGGLLLVALLASQWVWLSGHGRGLLAGSGPRALWALGFRNATHRPGRSLLCVALMAAATFIIVAVEAFRRSDAPEARDPSSGTGGFALLAESLLPIHRDLNSKEGKQALNLDLPEDKAVEGVGFVAFRLRPGDDASCLNLYQPRNPRILGSPPDFVKSGRFSFRSSLATSAAEKENPWLLLNRELDDGAIPVIADANSMTYVLHKTLGEDLLLGGGGAPLRLRLVGALADSLFQSEILMSEANFRRLFPRQEGFRFFLLDVEPERAGAVTEILERRLSDFGFDVAPAAERLAGFHRVENTYLSTFQALGGLGLVLGTLGLAAVLLRNVLERRRELALLRAVGFASFDFSLLVLAENTLLLLGGLGTGALTALIAITPSLLARGGSFSPTSLGLLLLAVLATGLIASLLAVREAVRSPLLEALRAE
jgi:putative ABC transport system permease protein